MAMDQAFYEPSPANFIYPFTGHGKVHLRRLSQAASATASATATSTAKASGGSDARAVSQADSKAAGQKLSTVSGHVVL